MHIIAISGSNFIVLTWLLLEILRRFVKKYWAPALLIPFIILYAVMVGEKSAVMRAAVMCIITMFGISIGRSQSGLE